MLRTLKVLTVALSTMLVSQAIAADIVSSIELLAKCDGNLFDESGKVRNGTAIGSLTYEASTLGQAVVMTAASNQGASFGTAVGIDSATAVTLQWRGKVTSLAQFQMFLSKITDVNNRIEVSAGGTGLGSTSAIAIGIGNGGSRSAYVDNKIVVGEDLDIIVVYDGSQSTNATKLRMWVNGVEETLVFSGTIPTSLPNMSTRNFTVGYRRSNEWFANIKTDVVRVFSRALATEDVEELHAETQPATPGTYITNAAPLRAVYELAKTRRVLVTIISDSNGFWTNVGYWEGLQYELNRLYGLYMMGPYPGNPISAQAGGINPYDMPTLGIRMNNWSTNTQSNTGALAAHHAYALPSNEYGSVSTQGQLQGYFHLTNTLTAAQGNPQGSFPTHFRGTCLVVDDCPLNLSGGYKVHATNGTFAAAGTGGTTGTTSSLNVRNSTTVLAHLDIESVTGVDGLEDYSVTVPPSDYSGQTHYVRYARLQGDEASGHQNQLKPFFSLCNSIEDHNKTNGCHVALWLWQGGLTSTDARKHLTDEDGEIALAGFDLETANKEWLRQVTMHQGDEPVMVVIFMHGANDVSLQVAPSQTAANADEVFTVIAGWWSDLGFDEDNLFFQPTVYQNPSNGVVFQRETIYKDYAARFEGDTQVTPVYMGQYTGTQIAAAGLEDSLTAHLEPDSDAYRVLSAVLMREILGSRYPVFGGVVK